MATTASEIQALYVAYFNRPAEPTGLAFWLARANANGGADFVANEFANSQEYRDTYKGMSNLQIVDQIYMNLFGRHAEAAGLVYWAQKLDSGELKFGNVARIISQSAQNADKVAIDSKLAAAAAFTGSLTTAEEILGYDGPAANAVLKAWLSGINTDAQLKAAITDAGMDAVAAAAGVAKEQANAVPSNLTDGTDTLIGTANAEKFIADSGTWTAFDSIDGGLGNDSLTVTEIGTAIDTAGKTVVNVETASLRSDKGVTATTTSWTGLTTLNITAAGDDVSVTAGTSTAVNVSNVTATSDVTVNGGKNISLTNLDAGAVDVNTAASTTVSAKNVDAATFTIDDTSTAGKTLTTVVLDGVVSAGKVIVTGDAVSNITVLNGTGTGVDVVNENTSDYTLNLTLGGNDDFTLTDTKGSADAVSVTVTEDTEVTIAAAAAEKLTVAGTGVLTLDAAGLTAVTEVVVTGAAGVASDLSALAIASFDASASTGENDVKLDGTVADLSVKGGSGADTITVAGGLTAEAVVNLGAGNDTYSFDLAATDGATVDAGAGTDTIAVIDGTQLTADTYVNFEVLEVGGGKLAYNMDDLVGVKAVTLTGAALVDDVAINNAAAGTTLEFKAVDSTDIDFVKAVTVDMKSDTTSNTQSITLTAVDGNDNGAADGVVTTGVINVADAETVSIVSQVATLDADDSASTGTDESTTADMYTNVIKELSSGDLKTLNVSGAANLEITTLTAAALTSIDAHTMTGGLKVDVALITQSIEFLGGSGNDDYTASAGGDTINAGAGADKIDLTAGGTKVDTIIIEAGDSKLNEDADGHDVITGFGVAGTLDVIDLGAFGFTGTRASALANKGALAASVTDGSVLTQTDFFLSGGADRAVAIGTNGAGTSTFVFVDVNKDGDFKAADDLMIEVVGTGLTLANFGF